MSHLPERSNITLSNTSVSTNYSFDATNKVVTIKDSDYSFPVTITNLKTGDVIFNINGTNAGDIKGSVVYLSFNTTSMNNDDQLVIVYVRSVMDDSIILNNILNELSIQTEILKSIASM